MVDAADRLWIWRNRTGLTQAQAAAELGISVRTYRRIEDGKVPACDQIKGRILTITLTVPERWMLVRRKSGLGLKAAARAFGISHVTLIKMEREADPALIDLWDAWLSTR